MSFSIAPLVITLSQSTTVAAASDASAQADAAVSEESQPSTEPVAEPSSYHEPVATTAAEQSSTSTTRVRGERIAADNASAGTWKVPESMRPGTRAHVLEFGFGPYSRWWGLEASYLYHLSGGPTGPAVGAVASGSAWLGSASFSFGGKFQWDFRLFPSQPLGLYVGPFATVAYQHRSAIRSDIGAHARLLFNDRWVVFVQPLVLGMYFFMGDANYWGRQVWPTYHASLGGGVTF
ncbi:MAG: hypothetical protein B7733_14380 [Myxococcales bacterium FL481]|nr:MAG: hypothetical protein B7733_14380 [Myxococcales bacterium FL481]